MQHRQVMGRQLVVAGRDPERTPMQWDSGPHAGFSRAQPWLPIADDYKRVNGAVQREEARSILSPYRELIRLRRSTPALAIGTYTRM